MTSSGPFHPPPHPQASLITNLNGPREGLGGFQVTKYRVASEASWHSIQTWGDLTPKQRGQGPRPPPMCQELVTKVSGLS